MSAITVKKKRRMLLILLEFQKVTIDALFDSGAYIKVISERNAGKKLRESNASKIENAQPPPFEIQNANTELENAFATYTMKLKIRDYTFEETFIVRTKTSYSKIGPAFLRKHSAIRDITQATIDFPKIRITLALKDELQKCKPKPITIKTEGNYTIPAQTTRTIHASVTVCDDHPITGTVQPLPQFDETAKLIVAQQKKARDKRVATKIANTTDCPYTINPHTKLAELQILKPEKTKSIWPIDIAPINLLTDHDDIVANANALMQVESIIVHHSTKPFPATALTSELIPNSKFA